METMPASAGERWPSSEGALWFNLPEKKFVVSPRLDPLCGYFYMACPFGGCPFLTPPGDLNYEAILEHVKTTHCFPVNPFYELIGLRQEPSRAPNNNVIFPFLDDTNLSDRAMSTHFRRLRASYLHCLAGGPVLLTYIRILIYPGESECYVCPYCNAGYWTELAIRAHVGSHVVIEKG
jgi:hypothetical protein